MTPNRLFSLLALCTALAFVLPACSHHDERTARPSAGPTDHTGHRANGGDDREYSPMTGRHERHPPYGSEQSHISQH